MSQSNQLDTADISFSSHGSYKSQPPSYKLLVTHATLSSSYLDLDTIVCVSGDWLSIKQAI